MIDCIIYRLLYYTLTKIEQADRIKLEDLLSTKLNPEIGTRLMRSLAQHWQQEGKELGVLEGLQVGEAKGIQIGEAKGKAEERVEIAKEMLSQGCNISLISSVTGLDEAFISSLE
ncbi:Transposase and inactivated derivative [Rickettsia africae ESF-5]|uniref:Transposase and inactivated derivative n=1 Tax=Rickettsia africae (strain ESF-5) TaxID=347255 RepID=C3PNP1_RICAE|nr:Transposase and inactivated derivative [Rickettsia africae ESF-5]